MADELTRYLTERDRYNGRGVLEERVRVEINSLASRLAAEVVAANPNLRAVIQAKATQLVTAALRDDAYLSEVVTKAVAEGLGQLVHRRLDENGDDD